MGYREQLNECTDPVSGDWIEITNVGNATDKEQKVNAAKFAILANPNTFTATQTFAPPAGSIGISITTPTNQAAAGMAIGAADCGTNYGPHISISRNLNASTPSSGFVYITNRGNTGYSIWPDASGNLRIGTLAPSSGNDTSGTVVGTQTSSLDSKNIIEPFSDYASALNAIVDAPLFDFTYKSGAFGGQRFTGIVTDYAPAFGMDRDEAHPAGKSLNEITAHGYTFAAIKALHARIEQLEQEVGKLQSMEAVWKNKN